MRSGQMFTASWRQQKTSDAPIIAITGYGSKSDREHSADAGIEHRLTKPVDTSQLNRLLAQIAPRANA